MKATMRRPKERVRINSWRSFLAANPAKVGNTAVEIPMAKIPKGKLIKRLASLRHDGAFLQGRSKVLADNHVNLGNGQAKMAGSISSTMRLMPGCLRSKTGR